MSCVRWGVRVGPVERTGGDVFAARLRVRAVPRDQQPIPIIKPINTFTILSPITPVTITPSKPPCFITLLWGSASIPIPYARAALPVGEARKRIGGMGDCVHSNYDAV